MRLRTLCVILALTSVTTAAPAPDTYDIRLDGDPTPGQSYVIKSTDKFTSTSAVTSPPLLSVAPEKRTTEEELVYTETVLEKPAKKGDSVPKFKRAYSRARQTTNGKAAALPYEGRTVVFQLKDGKYHATAEGKPALDAKVLDKLAQKESGTSAPKDSRRLFLPRRPVKVGQKWTIDGKEVAKTLPEDDTLVLDPERSRGEGTLRKAYRKGGKQYGIIEVRLKVALKKSGNLTFEKPAEMETKINVDMVIDGSSTAGTATMVTNLHGRGTITDDGQKITIDLSTEQSGRWEQSPEK